MLKSRQTISCGSAMISAKREKSEVKQCPPPFFQELKWLNLSYYICTSFPHIHPNFSYHWFPRTTRFEPVRVCASSFLATTTSQKQQQRAKMSHAQILDNKANTSSLSDVRPKLSANSVRSKIEGVDCLWRTRKVTRLSCWCRICQEVSSLLN